MCRQIYDEATPLFYSTNTFIIEPEYTVDFFTSLTPTNRCLIQSWATDLFLLGNRDCAAVRQYFQHQTNVKKILIADVISSVGRLSSWTIGLWRPVILEFLRMPKLQSLVFLYDENGTEGHEAFRQTIAKLVKPYLVREWKQQGSVFLLETGLEIVKKG
jgi:hypothetical protein